MSVSVPWASQPWHREVDRAVKYKKSRIGLPLQQSVIPEKVPFGGSLSYGRVDRCEAKGFRTRSRQFWCFGPQPLGPPRFPLL